VIETLTSASNPKIKKLLALQQKASERRESSLFTVEGRRELEHCLEAGYEADTIFICPEIAGEVQLPDCRIFELSRELYAKVAYREGTEGVIAEVKAREHSLKSLKLKGNPLVAVLESVEKPGNIGAVLRTCDAAGADALIICDPKADIYNPNLIRASLGAVFTVQTAVCESAEAIRYLKDKGIQILTAQLQDSSLYYDRDMRGGTAIVMGTESTGLSEVWRKAADAHIMIPMLGRLDSLNVSVSAAILLYESVRQRNNG
jgi:RNA methyltransferase, TrmH family